ARETTTAVPPAGPRAGLQAGPWRAGEPGGPTRVLVPAPGRLRPAGQAARGRAGRRPTARRGPAARGLAAESLAAGRLAVTGRTSAGASSSASAAASWGSRMTERALAGAFCAFFGRALGGWLCHTRAVTRISSFSANGAIRHQVRGSATYRSCELTSSGSRLFSMTGLVVSQVRT